MSLVTNAVRNNSEIFEFAIYRVWDQSITNTYTSLYTFLLQQRLQRGPDIPQNTILEFMETSNS